MTVELRIRRQDRGAARETAYWQRFLVEIPAEDETSATVATALELLNANKLYAQEAPARPVMWEHSCLQRKCGACAMVINGRPSLACQARLSEEKQPIFLEALRKFPVVEDLCVDRQILFDHLRRVEVWLSEEKRPKDGTVLRERTGKTVFEASRCLQCGCCLEVCPNFSGDPAGHFAGTASAVPLARLLALTDGQEKKKAAQRYRNSFFEGCGKSLACRSVCPAGVDVERLIAGGNAAAVWRSLFAAAGAEKEGDIYAE